MKRVQLRFPGILDADGELHPAIARNKFSLRLTHEQAATAFRSLRSPLTNEPTPCHRFHLSICLMCVPVVSGVAACPSNSSGISFRDLGPRFVCFQELS